MHAVGGLGVPAVVVEGGEGAAGWEGAARGGGDVSQEAKLDLVGGAGVFGVIFKAGALEVLDGEAAFLELLGARVAEDVEAAVGIKEVAEAEGEVVAGLL